MRLLVGWNWSLSAKNPTELCGAAMLTLLKLRMILSLRSVLLKLTLIALLLVVGACRGGRDRATERIAEDSSAAEQFDGRLTFDNITLEQADEQGQLVWKVDAEQATYSRDQQIAQVKNPDGELFQDGKLVFRIKAQSGEVQQNGERIFLKGQIVATDTRDGTVLRGNELEWRPKEDLLIVRDNLTGTHPQVTASAREARAFSRDRRIELIGQVVARAKDPSLQLQTEHLIWHVAEQRIVGDRPIQIDRYEGQQVTDRATGNKSEVNLKTKIATLEQNAQLVLQKPPLQVASESLTWNLSNETVLANKPVNVVHRQQRVNLSADQGRFDLTKEIVYLNNNVQVVGQRNQSQLNSNQLTWSIPSREVVAEGNVVYRQADPPFNLSGPRAVGKLEQETVVISGGRVVTEIIPDGL